MSAPHLSWRSLESEGSRPVVALASLVDRLSWLDRLHVIAAAYELGQTTPRGVNLVLPIARFTRTATRSAGAGTPFFGVTIWPPEPSTVMSVRSTLAPVTVTQIAFASHRDKLSLWVAGADVAHTAWDTIERLGGAALARLPDCFGELVLAHEIVASPQVFPAAPTQLLRVLDHDADEEIVVLIDADNADGFAAFVGLIAQAAVIGMRQGTRHRLALCVAHDVNGQTEHDEDPIIAVDASGDHLLRTLCRLGRRAPGIGRIGHPYWGAVTGRSVVCLPVTLEPHATSGSASGCLRRVRHGSALVPEQLLVIWEPPQASTRWVWLRHPRRMPRRVAPLIAL